MPAAQRTPREPEQQVAKREAAEEGQEGVELGGEEAVRVAPLRLPRVANGARPRLARADHQVVHARLPHEHALREARARLVGGERHVVHAEVMVGLAVAVIRIAAGHRHRRCFALQRIVGRDYQMARVLGTARRHAAARRECC